MTEISGSRYPLFSIMAPGFGTWSTTFPFPEILMINPVFFDPTHCISHRESCKIRHASASPCLFPSSALLPLKVHFLGLLF